MDWEDDWEPTGFLAATAHDFDDHSRCDPRACPNAEREDDMSAPPVNLLSAAPEYVSWFASNGDFDEGEVPIGYFTETVPDGPGRVKPGLWVIVTDRGLYYLDADTGVCVRARVLHPASNLTEEG